MSFTATSLQPHPEGGAFREVFRSDRSVTEDGGESRSALTHIYFQLKPDEVSRFHRVEQEEVWNLYEGSGTLWILDPVSKEITSFFLSARERRYCAVVPAGHWQATDPGQEGLLAGCSVAPGFEFSDFSLMTPHHELAQAVLKAGLPHLL